ncbi:MAG TPA: DUF4038 domain-containing protein [Clostridiales bacterium]|nr:DUF4038 domain-containing protein [Clostridiales bacterium]
MKQYQMMELSFHAGEPVGSQALVDLNAVFTKDGVSISVPGFYAGGGVYKVRFYPREAGLYQWKVSGIIEASGEELCEASRDGHGMVKANGTHFQHEDGTMYLPFGTTVYALLHQEKALTDETMGTLSRSPFNKVRFCVFPKHFDYNHNDPEYFAFEKTEGKFDVHRPCFVFWDAMEQRLAELGKMGIEADLILFHPYDKWGFATLPREDCLVYLDYATRRLSAFPNLWWSLANEYDLLDKSMDCWKEFARYIAAHDPYGHLLSNHNFIRFWDFANPETTHVCIQDKNVEEVKKWTKKYNKPVIYDECGYEGNTAQSWGNLSAFEMVNRFWTACVCGGYCTHGETFVNEEEILWWSKGGTLKGESPARIGFLKELLYSFPGPVTYLDDGKSPDPEMMEQMKGQEIPGVTDNPMFQAIARLPKEDLERLVASFRNISGHYGDEIFIKYFERMCAGKGTMELPDTGKYKIEVIDVWEMTRKTALEGVNGTVEVELPGKEGIALLAVRM